MFTNTEVITVFHKEIDPVKRLETWEKHTFNDVYWENCSAQTYSKTSQSARGMTEDNSILCIVPEKSVSDFIPCKDDLIIKGDADNREGAFTIMSVKDFRYGSDSVHHLEVNAK